MRYRIAPAYRRIYRALSLRPRGFRVLILHHVTEQETPALANLVDYIQLEHGVLAPEEAEVILSGDDSRLPQGKTPWLVTFDDGFVSNYEIAQSILQPRSIRALFFVCPGLIDAPPADQRRLIDDYVFPSEIWKPSWPIPRMMTWQEIRSLTGIGHSVGSHSMLHLRLSRLSDADLEVDIDRSAQRLREELGTESTWFAFPFGNLDSVSETVLATVIRHFKFCCSGVRGVNTSATHPSAVLRDGVDLAAPEEYLQLIADGGLEVLYRRQRRRLLSMAATIPNQQIA